jgi:hypothetical protein
MLYRVYLTLRGIPTHNIMLVVHVYINRNTIQSNQMLDNHTIFLNLNLFVNLAIFATLFQPC